MINSDSPTSLLERNTHSHPTNLSWLLLSSSVKGNGNHPTTSQEWCDGQIRKDVSYFVNFIRPMHWQRVINIAITGLFPKPTLSRPFSILYFGAREKHNELNTLEVDPPMDRRKHFGHILEELSFNQRFLESQRFSPPRTSCRVRNTA